MARSVERSNVRNVQRTSATPSSPPSCATHRTLPVSAPTFRSQTGILGILGTSSSPDRPARTVPPSTTRDEPERDSLSVVSVISGIRVSCAVPRPEELMKIPFPSPSSSSSTSILQFPGKLRDRAWPFAFSRVSRSPRGGANAASFPNPEARCASRARTTSTGAGLRSRTRRLTEPSAARRSAPNAPSFRSLAPTKTRSNAGANASSPRRRRDGTASSTGQRSTGNGSFDNGDDGYGS